MNKKKIRQISIYVLLAFIVFLYIFSILVFLFGETRAAIGVFSYTTFFTVVIYFLIILQKRVIAKEEESDTTNDENASESSSTKK